MGHAPLYRHLVVVLAAVWGMEGAMTAHHLTIWHCLIVALVMPIFVAGRRSRG